DRAVGKREVQVRKQAGGTYQISAVRQSCLFSNLVPGNPDWSCPEPGDERLVGGTRGADVLPEALHLIQRRRIGDALQAGWGGGAELVGGVQHEWGHIRPIGEDGLNEFRRRQLIITRVVAGCEDWRGRAGSVVGAERQHAFGSLVAYADSVPLGVR